MLAILGKELGRCDRKRLTSFGSAGSVTTSQIVPFKAWSDVARAKPTSIRLDSSLAETTMKLASRALCHFSRSRAFAEIKKKIERLESVDRVHDRFHS